MGIIQCGSFVGNTTVNIGWEPQWIMIKRTDAAGDWIVIDSMRGCSVGGIDAVLNPNLANAESVSNDYIDFTATGFITKNLTGTYIYTVIRRPNKPPTTGTEVFAPVKYGTGGPNNVGGYWSGFPTDFHLELPTNLAYDRMRGGVNFLQTNLTNAEGTHAATYKRVYGNTMSGFEYPTDGTGRTGLEFKRAPGFFEICCYTGTGATNKIKNHNLGAVPELMIIKNRGPSGYTQNWVVYPGPLGADKYMFLNTAAAAATFGAYWDNTPPTSSTFSVGDYQDTNASTLTYVAYLFATLPGVSKVGSYTGNGTSQTINCGFTTGCRFFLVKSTSTTGNWWTFDSTRGIVAASDPALALNSTSAEITSADAVDNDSSGIIVNQEATCSINASGVSYIFLAIA